MQLYTVIVRVGYVSGSQSYTVRAASADEAVTRIRDGEGELTDTDLEVEALDWTDITVEGPNV